MIEFGQRSIQGYPIMLSAHLLILMRNQKEQTIHKLTEIALWPLKQLLFNYAHE